MMKLENESEFNALKLLIQVSTKIKNSELKDYRLKKIEAQLKDLANYLDCKEKEALIFAVIFALFVAQTQRLDTSDIARYLSVDYLELLMYQNDLEGLIKKGLIKAKNNLKSIPYKNANFTIESSILQAIYSNEKIVIENYNTKQNNFDFVSKISNIIELRSEEEITTSSLIAEMENLEDEFEEINLVKKLKEIRLNELDKLLFYGMCNDFLEYGFTHLNITLSNTFDSFADKICFLRGLKCEKNRLQEMNLIKLEGGDFFTDTTLKLTEKGVEIFLEEDAKLFTTKSEKNILKPENLTYMELIYDEELKKKVDFLTQSLMSSNHQKLQNRLNQKALPMGITVIFFGAPGTGKTETAYQIAKQTGREIMQVDISQTKSMWFGESEKIIKEVFNDYRKICTQKKNTPILLFNEADAVFGKRKDSSFSNVTQTENALQNIILEEMEKFDGILFATTNLNQNLDVAFERRFLFKLKFDNPSTETKLKIWKDKLPTLAKNEADELARKFAFSGGEIENIIRKISMDEVLNGENVTFEKIIQHCEVEKFENRKRVGF
ncbi:MAG: AAA family ATPase [Bacteroidia bacterium]|nr:AAA family ATPase [Bacteroidia bacterium]